MAKSSKKKAKKLPKSLRTGGLPRPVGEVWAAGVGALAQARKAGGDQFEALVKLGTTVAETGTGAARSGLHLVEAAAGQLVGSARHAAEDAAGGVQGTVEAAVEAVLARTGVPGRKEVLALREQVEALQARVSALQTPAADAPASGGRASGGAGAAAASGPAASADGEPGTGDASGPDAAGAPDRAVYAVAKHERGWAVEREGAGRAASVHATKKEALVQARQTAREHAPSRLVVCNADGSVSGETDYDA